MFVTEDGGERTQVTPLRSTSSKTQLMNSSTVPLSDQGERVVEHGGVGLGFNFFHSQNQDLDFRGLGVGGPESCISIRCTSSMSSPCRMERGCGVGPDLREYSTTHSFGVSRFRVTSSHVFDMVLHWPCSLSNLLPHVRFSSRFRIFFRYRGRHRL